MFVIGTPLPGKKAIAQGESNVATSETLKGRFPVDEWLGAAPQDARIKNRGGLH